MAFGGEILTVPLIRDRTEESLIISLGLRVNKNPKRPQSTFKLICPTPPETVTSRLGTPSGTRVRPWYDTRNHGLRTEPRLTREAGRALGRRVRRAVVVVIVNVARSTRRERRSRMSPRAVRPLAIIFGELGTVVGLAWIRLAYVLWSGEVARARAVR